MTMIDIIQAFEHALTIAREIQTESFQNDCKTLKDTRTHVRNKGIHMHVTYCFDIVRCVTSFSASVLPHSATGKCTLKEILQLPPDIFKMYVSNLISALQNKIAAITKMREIIIKDDYKTQKIMQNMMYQPHTSEDIGTSRVGNVWTLPHSSHTNACRIHPTHMNLTKIPSHIVHIFASRGLISGFQN